MKNNQPTTREAKRAGASSLAIVVTLLIFGMPSRAGAGVVAWVTTPQQSWWTPIMDTCEANIGGAITHWDTAAIRICTTSNGGRRLQVIVDNLGWPPNAPSGTQPSRDSTGGEVRFELKGLPSSAMVTPPSSRRSLAGGVGVQLNWRGGSFGLGILTNLPRIFRFTLTPKNAKGLTQLSAITKVAGNNLLVPFSLGLGPVTFAYPGYPTMKK